MSAKSKIQWTDDTHNFWRGCTKVSPGCKNCYAEALVTTRLGGKWGPGAPRDISKDFYAPLNWNKRPWVCSACDRRFSADLYHGICPIRACSHRDRQSSNPTIQQSTVHRRRVFSLSLGDIFDREVKIKWFADALNVIWQCEDLTWQLVTKRPEAFFDRLTEAYEYLFKLDRDTELLRLFITQWLYRVTVPQNIWIIASAEDQPTLNERVPLLLNIPAAVHGLSCEPLLGPLQLTGICSSPVCFNALSPGPLAPGKLDWVIVGGESGPHARPSNIEWIRSIVAQCQAAAVPCFVKQLGSKPFLPGVSGYGSPDGDQYVHKFPVQHKKGGDMSEWPADLRIRQFPEL